MNAEKSPGKMRILVVGGAGYIGSHAVLALHEAGHEVATLDDFSTGYRDAILAGEVVTGSCADAVLLDRIFRERCYDGVMHFASLIQVGESARDPASYYRNNVAHTLTLLDAMRRNGVRNLIFSSSAAVYGEPLRIPINEEHPLAPVNPYGASKFMVERMLPDFAAAYGLRYVALRYFNAAGADPETRIGERHVPETHLIPLVLQAISGNTDSTVGIFGTDWDTPDGTCIRDYIHVSDLAMAHLLAMSYLRREEKSAAFNLGNGNGFSVREVINAAERVSGRTVPVKTAPRRPGDPARLVADATRARALLGWRPQYADLETIIAHAWNWEQKQAAKKAREDNYASY